LIEEENEGEKRLRTEDLERQATAESKEVKVEHLE